MGENFHISLIAPHLSGDCCGQRSLNLGSSIGCSPLRDVPAPAWVLHHLQSPQKALLWHGAPHPKSASPGVFPTMSPSTTPPFCFSKCISSHFSSSDHFLCVLLCLHSHILFVCPHMHPHLSPLVFPFVSPLVSPPGSPVPNSYYSHSYMSEQRCHVILREVKVLTSDRLLPSIAKPSGASCGWHQHHPCYLPKPCQLCPIQRSIFYSPR